MARGLMNRVRRKPQRIVPDLRRGGHKSIQLLVIDVLIEWTPQFFTPPYCKYEFQRKFAFLALLPLVITGILPDTKDLVPNGML